MIFDIINGDPGFMSSGFLDGVTAPGVHSFLPVDTRADFIENLKKNP